jgi:hypothetical protein
MDRIDSLVLGTKQTGLATAKQDLLPIIESAILQCMISTFSRTVASEVGSSISVIFLDR